MREVALVACVALAGCNAAFGLEPTISIDAKKRARRVRYVRLTL